MYIQKVVYVMLKIMELFKIKLELTAFSEIFLLFNIF